MLDSAKVKSSNQEYGEGKTPILVALEELQKAMEGEAERVGWKSEEDVVEYCKEIRRELAKKHGYIN
jgi:hypothetical protein